MESNLFHEHTTKRVPRKSTVKREPRLTDGVQYPVEVRKVEPIVPTERTLSAAQAEAVALMGTLPKVGSQG